MRRSARVLPGDACRTAVSSELVKEWRLMARRIERCGKFRSARWTVIVSARTHDARYNRRGIRFYVGRALSEPGPSGRCSINSPSAVHDEKIARTGCRCTRTGEGQDRYGCRCFPRTAGRPRLEFAAARRLIQNGASRSTPALVDHCLRALGPGRVSIAEPYGEIIT